MKDAACLILGAGEIADYAEVRRLAGSGSYVVCADGGLRHCRGLGLEPDLVVGDFDSLPEGVSFSGRAERIALSRDKDYTDSFHAAQEALDRGYRRLLLAGMLGGRLDHTVANLQLLARCAGLGADALLTDGVTQARAHAGAGELVLRCRPGCSFSLLAFGRCRAVTILGGKYPLEGYDLEGDDPRAVSNEFCGGDVRILKGDGILVVISQPKEYHI